MDPLSATCNKSNNQKHQQQQHNHLINPFQPQSLAHSSHYHHPHNNFQSQPSPNSSWPSSPLIKPHLIGSPSSTQNQQSIVWPHRSNSSTSLYKPANLNHQPRSPIREDHRRPINSISSKSSPPSSPLPQSSSQSFSNNPIISSDHNQKVENLNSNQIKRQIKIKVIGIERNRRDLYVKIDGSSNPSRSSHSSSTSRSYREFLSFHESLVGNNPHTIVPPVPFPNTSAPNPADDDRLVASAFQQFFDRLLLDPSLRADDELRLFLESDFRYTPQSKPKRRTTSSGSGWLSKPAAGASVRTLPSSNLPQSSSNCPDTIVSVVEEDELSNAKLQFRLLEDRFTECFRSVEQLSRARRTLSHALLELSSRLTQFSTTESHDALAEGFRRLGQTLKAVSELETNSAIGYLVTFSDGLSWCSLSAKAAKDVLRNRAGVLQEHYASVKKSIEKRRQIERIKSNTLSVSSERVENALDELEEAKKAEENIAQKAMLISTNLRPALQTHSKMLHDDLLHSLMENARTQLIYEKQILKELERVKPELDSISLRPAKVVYRQTVLDEANRPSQDQENHVPDRMVSSRTTESNRSSYSKGPSLSNSMISSGRIGEIAKGLVVSTSRGENVDIRQRVDAKSAAASLARLF
ncbi:hypothetical protein O181_018031 [Austropuccinia psidii MF-1]|uniref:PX domain-containing protein n=1 Tax=Austropuccinia psidii MF-1 TaxID=1389203 RepID=A0A9Q3GSJ2_9BASI|nr:hypothetical protein [Austropuccinia psidii MF-1]